MTKRKGFTLVELLIVVVIIGVLTSMMTVSSSDSIDKADAASIIGNLKSMKTAALAIYIESRDDAANYTNTALKTGNLITAIWNYLGVKSNSSYDVYVGTNASEVYVFYDLGNSSQKIKDALATKKDKVGLMQYTTAATLPTAAPTEEYNASSAKMVAIKVF